MRISVVGLGKLGCPLLAVLASKGHEVIGIDINKAFVDKINKGIAPIEEPELQALLQENGHRISATTDWNKAVLATDVTMIIVPTPSGDDGGFRNDYVLSVIDGIGRVLAKKLGYHLVVVNATTMPGSVGGPIRQRLEQCAGRKLGRDLGLCYNPEFVALGEVITGLLHPDFILIGESDKKAGDLLESIYRTVAGRQANVVRMSLINAELAKISVNAYVTMKISFANTLGEICDRLDGADASVVANAIGLDSRIGKKYLNPSIGYGGPCFPRDTIAFGRVAQLVGAKAELALATDLINRRQVLRLAEIVSRITPPGGKVAVLGLSYKPRTPVIEESQGVTLAQLLRQAGFAVVAHDPMARVSAQAPVGEAIRIVASAREAVEEADVTVIVTPWPEYAAIDINWLAGGRRRIIIDCWRQLEPEAFAGSCLILQLGNQRSLTAAGNQLATG